MQSIAQIVVVSFSAHDQLCYFQNNFMAESWAITTQNHDESYLHDNTSWFIADWQPEDRHFTFIKLILFRQIQ